MIAVKRYPSPDWKFFAKNTAGLASALAFLHWVPELAAWIHLSVWGETLVMNSAKYQRVLYVAYAMGGVALSIHEAGLLWAAWQNRKSRP